MSSMWDPAGRRSSIQIIRDMLDLIRFSDPSKTAIMSQVNMSYAQTQRYLVWLIQSGMLEVMNARDSSSSYKITPKGLKLLSTIESIQKMLARKEVISTPNS